MWSATEEVARCPPLASARACTDMCPPPPPNKGADSDGYWPSVPFLPFAWSMTAVLRIVPPAVKVGLPSSGNPMEVCLEV